MKITGIQGIPVESNLIVRVDADQGACGIGEAGMAPPIPATIERAQAEVEFCNSVAEYNLLFVEDPIRPEDPAGYRQIRNRIGTPIATCENLYSKW